MDRRQRKTREAIFKAFINLLSKKEYGKITVGEIIENSDVGRATFYAHFETKDFLLKELCEELFCHVFDSISNEDVKHKHIFQCEVHESVFHHLFMHFQKNDNNILALIGSNNNDIFLTYFKSELKKLLSEHPDVLKTEKSTLLPESFYINHVVSSFVETLRWWISDGMKEPTEKITSYFLLTV